MTAIPRAMLPPPPDIATMQGIVPAEAHGHQALWVDPGTGAVLTALVLAWRVVGAAAYPVTALPSEPEALKRPDGVIIDQHNGQYWATEDAWLQARAGGSDG